MRELLGAPKFVSLEGVAFPKSHLYWVEPVIEPKVEPKVEPKPALFTQEHVNAMMKENKLTMQTEIATLRMELEKKGDTTALQTKLADLEAKLGPLIDKFFPKLEDKPKNTEEALAALTLKINELAESGMKVKELEKALEKETKTRIDSEERSMVTEYRGLLSDSLVEIGCLDIPRAIKLLFDYGEFDTEKNEWLMVDEDKTVYSLKEGVKKLLPEYMVKPLTPITGSGAVPSKAVVDAAEQEIKNLDAALKDAQAEAAKNPHDQSLVSKVMRLNTEVQDKKRALKAATKT